MHIKIGTRSSTLAQSQAQAVADALRREGHTAELVLFHTRGDQVLDRALHEIGQKGLFTAELEKALLDESVDLAVHSLKDLPTELPPQLAIGAYALPEDPRDALISHGAGLDNLGPGSRIGTSSLRRAAFIRSLRPDISLVPIRGNLETRREKWGQGQVDALVLAAAGIKRLGWEALITEYLDPTRVVPSPGQGILAVEAAVHRRDLAAVLAALNHDGAAVRAAAERGALAELGGGCQVPMGAYAFQSQGGSWRLVAQVASVDGRECIRHEAEFEAQGAVQTGHAAGRYLRDHGALSMLDVQEG